MCVNKGMKKVFDLFGKNFYWAGKGFLKKGLYFWTGKKNQRIIVWF